RQHAENSEQAALDSRLRGNERMNGRSIRTGGIQAGGLAAASAIGIACALFAAMPSARIAAAEDAVAGAIAPPARELTPGTSALRHLEALQAIATANAGNRAAGTAGYDQSAQYVAEKLKAAGYSVSFEEFEFPFFE